jgi:carotenoid cleavage dioxygenase-like enzyme
LTLHLDHLPQPQGPTEPSEQNPYLEGLYAPTYDELTLPNLELLEGQIPDDLNGVYVRNGPNPAYQPIGRYHWFDGDGMVHAVHFSEGAAAYRNRWVRTDGFQREQAAGTAVWRGIMEPFADNPTREKDTANTDVVFHHDRLLALWYRAGTPYALDPVTLETIEADDFGGSLRCEVSAHAKVDERTGELMFFDYGITPPYMRYGVVGADGRVNHFVPIDLPGPRLPHDMAITERYSILMDLPLVNDVNAQRSGRYRLLFEPDLPSRFAVIPRYGGAADVRWFEADPCYIYHSINAWEDGNEIVLDACRVKRPKPRPDLSGPLAQMLTYLRLDAHVHRYRFDLVSGRTREEVIDDDNSEFPAINLGMTGRRARYAYNMHISPEKTLLFDGLMRYDLETASVQTRWFGDGRWGSEASFAPRPGATEEDDGYLISYVYDERERHTEVVVLDAADVTGELVCRIEVPARVPLGFHATWVPGERLPEAPADG